jgi:LPXTG-motif cell wall-anchored protein
VQLVNNYGFLLDDDSQVVMTDPLGEGMEVKGDPVLSYFGVIYKNPTKTTNSLYTEYTWKVSTTTQDSDTKGQQTLDLSVIKARLYTSNGNQTMIFYIPESVMPTLYPDLYKQFYYEELPVRLIYKVGLTDEAVENAQDGDVFYTNLYYEDTEQAATTVTFSPDSTNDYYTSSFADVENQKSNNITDTADTYFTESVSVDDDNDIVVTQTLGNNGMLTVSKDDTLSVTVEKDWQTANKAASVEVALYATGQRVMKGTEVSVNGTWLIGTVTLSNTNNWKSGWTNISRTATIDNYNYYYDNFYVTEVNSGDYLVAYQDSSGAALTPTTLSFTTFDDSGSVTNNVSAVLTNGGTVKIINSERYQLPYTGGSGTAIFTVAGMIILIAAGFGYIVLRKVQKRRVEGGDG